MLLHINIVPPSKQEVDAHKLHLHLATHADLSLEFPQSSLRQRYAMLGHLFEAQRELDM